MRFFPKTVQQKSSACLACAQLLLNLLFIAFELPNMLDRTICFTKTEKAEFVHKMGLFWALLSLPVFFEKSFSRAHLFFLSRFVAALNVRCKFFLPLSFGASSSFLGRPILLYCRASQPEEKKRERREITKEGKRRNEQNGLWKRGKKFEGLQLPSLSSVRTVAAPARDAHFP